MVASAAGFLLPVQSYNTKSRLNAVFVQMANFFYYCPVKIFETGTN